MLIKIFSISNISSGEISESKTPSNIGNKLNKKEGAIEIPTQGNVPTRNISAIDSWKFTVSISLPKMFRIFCYYAGLIVLFPIKYTLKIFFQEYENAVLRSQ